MLKVRERLSRGSTLARSGWQTQREPRTKWSDCAKPCSGVRERSRGIKADVTGEEREARDARDAEVSVFTSFASFISSCFVFLVLLFLLLMHRASVSGECQVHPKDGGVPCGSQEKVLLFLDNSFNLSALQNESTFISIGLTQATSLSEMEHCPPEPGQQSRKE